MGLSNGVPRAQIAYVYAFVVRLKDGESPAMSSHTRDMLAVQLYGRLEMQFESEVEFAVFRSNLDEDGFELREIERWPYHQPETVL